MVANDPHKISIPSAHTYPTPVSSSLQTSGRFVNNEWERMLKVATVANTDTRKPSWLMPEGSEENAKIVTEDSSSQIWHLKQAPHLTNKRYPLHYEDQPHRKNCLLCEEDNTLFNDAKVQLLRLCNVERMTS
jgi:hypothetical protein